MGRRKKYLEDRLRREGRFPLESDPKGTNKGTRGIDRIPAIRHLSPRNKKQWMATRVAWPLFRATAGIHHTRTFMDALRLGGVSRPNALAWINGFREPKLFAARAFCKANNCTLERFAQAVEDACARARQHVEMQMALGPGATLPLADGPTGKPAWNAKEWESKDPESESVDALLILYRPGA